MKKCIKNLIDRDRPKQPEKCRGCVWGKWQGTVQYCSMIKCVKENEK